MKLALRYLPHLAVISALFFSCLATAFSSNLDNQSHSNTENSANCDQDISDSQTRQANPGVYYFRIAVCKLDAMHDVDSFYEVVDLFKKSASKNYAPSYFALGLLFDNKYKHGSIYYGVRGKPKDLIFAIQNYTKAADYGSAWAQNNLGEIYLDYANLSDKYRKERKLDVSANEYVEVPDLDKAIYWLENAAHKGNAASQGTLADLYKQGIGVPQNYVMSYVWDNLSVASQLRFNKMMQEEGAGQEMANLHKKIRDELYKKLSIEQRNQAQTLLEQYTSKYFLRPNELDLICSALQTVILSDNILTVFNNAQR